MVGILKVGESDKGFHKNGVTSTFYRLEKLDYIVPEKKLCPFYDVWEFYTVNNGFVYIRHHEEHIRENNTRNLGGIYKDNRLGFGSKAKEEGNKKYKKLKEQGYKFVGIYECDTCGYSRRIR